MKLCWLIADDKGGGIVSVAVSCARQAAVAGFDVTLLLLLSPSGWLNREPLAGVAVQSLDCAPGDPTAPVKIIRWLVEHPHEVIFINGVGEFDDALAHIPPSTRAVYVVHDTAPRYWQSALKAEASLDAVVAVSETVAREFRARMSDPTKLHVIHNGSYFPPEPDLTMVRPEHLLFCGGDRPAKGGDDVLKLWAVLLGKGFGGELHWYGAVSPEFAKKVASAPGSDRIHLHGRCTRDELFARASTCRVFLMLSRVEPFGMLTIEAMSMGLVPVAWDINTGTKEIIEEDLGFFAPLGNYEQLAVAVQTADRQQSAMAKTISASVRTNFDETCMWRGYAELLRILKQDAPVSRPLGGQSPMEYKAPVRLFQLLPCWLRKMLRAAVSSSPRLNHLMRDLRGL